MWNIIRSEPSVNDGLRLLRETPDINAVLEISDDEELEESGERKVICKLCQATITALTSKVEVDGGHSHTFFNPAGMVFEIGCFSSAPGCIVQGERSTEFSWFSGFSWRYCHCSHCMTHLGWQFQSGETAFFGLVLNRLLF